MADCGMACYEASYMTLSIRQLKSVSSLLITVPIEMLSLSFSLLERVSVSVERACLLLRSKETCPI